MSRQTSTRLQLSVTCDSDNSCGHMEPGEEDAVIDTPIMKCRKCRWVLLAYPKVKVQDSHGREPFGGSSVSQEGQQSESSLIPLEIPQAKKTVPCSSDVWYIPEECVPDWMCTDLDKGEWVKGKINCPNPKCDARIGAYSFTTGLRCHCRSEVVPPIHIVKSKVDFTKPMRIVRSFSEDTSTMLISTSGNCLPSSGSDIPGGPGLDGKS